MAKELPDQRKYRAEQLLPVTLELGNDIKRCLAEMQVEKNKNCPLLNFDEIGRIEVRMTVAGYNIKNKLQRRNEDTHLVDELFKGYSELSEAWAQYKLDVHHSDQKAQAWMSKHPVKAMIDNPSTLVKVASCIVFGLTGVYLAVVLFA